MLCALKNKGLVCVLLLFSVWFSSCKFSSDVPERLSFDEYIKKAEAYLNEGKAEKAIVAYKKALRINPKDGKVHFRLGEIYYQEYSKSFDGARRKGMLDSLLHPDKKHDRDVIKEHEKYGLKSEYLDLAMGEYREAIKYDPNNWVARYYVAGDYKENQDYEEAINEYQKVIELNPTYPNAYVFLAEVYEKQKLYDEAIENLKTSLQLDPNYEYAYYKLGLVYKKAGQGEKTHEILQKLKSMNSYWYDELRLSLFSKDRKDQ